MPRFVRLSLPDHMHHVLQRGNYVTAVAYDSAGRVSSTAYPSGLVVGRSYNATGYLSGLTNGAGAAIWTPNAMDASLNLTQQTYGNGVVTTQAFDARERITNIDAVFGSTTVREFGYAWDQAGNLSVRHDYGHTYENFQYDLMNRLTQSSFSVGPATVKTFAYDATGDITCKSDLGDCSSTAPNYSYNPSGAGSVRPHAVKSIAGTVNSGSASVANPVYAYDADGRMLSGGGRYYSYTGFGAPATIHNSAGTSTFTFDSEHQRSTQTAPEGTTVYISAQGVRSELFTPTGGAATWRSYVFAGGQIVDMVQTSGSTTTDTYFHTDHLGSTVALTNDAGGVIETDAYDPWGKRRNVNGADDPGDAIASAANRGYTGQEHLADSALIHMNARVYDPQIGKFGSGDPLDGPPAGAGGWNRYAYVGNNPLNRTDPTGMDFWDDFFNDIFGDTFGGMLDGDDNDGDVYMEEITVTAEKPKKPPP